MKRLICEMCGSTELIKQDGLFICKFCGCKYTVEEAKKMMVEGTVDVQGTVKVDNSAFVQKYLANARRALGKEDWEEVEKYYNMVEQNVPNNMEAVFFSSFGKAMLSLTDSEYFKREQKFSVLNKSISVINEYFEESTEDKEYVLRKISDAIEKMYSVAFIYGTVQNQPVQANRYYTIQLENSIRSAFLIELKQIKEVHPEITYLDELIAKNSEQRNTGAPNPALAGLGFMTIGFVFIGLCALFNNGYMLIPALISMILGLIVAAVNHVGNKKPDKEVSEMSNFKKMAFEKATTENENIQSGGTWKCRYCGSLNSASAKNCASCGETKG